MSAHRIMLPEIIMSINIEPSSDIIWLAGYHIKWEETALRMGKMDVGPAFSDRVASLNVVF